MTAIDWLEAPAEGSRAWLVETCRAELEWERADWRRLGGDDDDGFGAHPCEAWRLPHEAAAARLVNCHLHVDVETRAIRDLRPRLHSQRRAATDATQSAAYRLVWANRAAGTLSDLQVHRRQRHLAWRSFLAAADDYRRLRAVIAPRRPANAGAQIDQIDLRAVA